MWQITDNCTKIDIWPLLHGIYKHCRRMTVFDLNFAISGAIDHNAQLFQFCCSRVHRRESAALVPTFECILGLRAEER